MRPDDPRFHCAGATPLPVVQSATDAILPLYAISCLSGYVWIIYTAGLAWIYISVTKRILDKWRICQHVTVDFVLAMVYRTNSIPCTQVDGGDR